MRIVILLLVLVATSRASAQDAVTYRNRGESGQQSIKGKIESESVAGIKISGKTIAARDIVDVQYEIPGSIKLDLPKAVQAELAGRNDEAVREYRALINAQAVANNKPLKRYFEYKIAWLTSARADNDADGWREAIDALSKFIQAHPDSWQRVPVVRLLARLYLDANPPNFDTARKVHDDLAQSSGATAELKSDCALAAIDLLIRQNKKEEARNALAAVSTTDPRVAVYQTQLAANPANLEPTIKALEQQRDLADNTLKPVIYNALGDCFRQDAKRKKDALFAYLWVDVVYNFDPVETAKAQDRLSELFRELKDDDRAKLYRNKARGR